MTQRVVEQKYVLFEIVLCNVGSNPELSSQLVLCSVRNVWYGKITDYIEEFFIMHRVPQGSAILMAHDPEDVVRGEGIEGSLDELRRARPNYDIPIMGISILDLLMQTGDLCREFRLQEPTEVLDVGEVAHGLPSRVSRDQLHRVFNYGTRRRDLSYWSLLLRESRRQQTEVESQGNDQKMP